MSHQLGWEPLCHVKALPSACTGHHQRCPAGATSRVTKSRWHRITYFWHWLCHITELVLVGQRPVLPGKHQMPFHFTVTISDTWNKFLESLCMTQRRKPFIRESPERDLPHHCLLSMDIKWQQHLALYSQIGTEWLHLPSQQNSNQFHIFLCPLLCSPCRGSPCTTKSIKQISPRPCCPEHTAGLEGAGSKLSWITCRCSCVLKRSTHPHFCPQKLPQVRTTSSRVSITQQTEEQCSPLGMFCPGGIKPHHLSTRAIRAGQSWRCLLLGEVAAPTFHPKLGAPAVLVDHNKEDDQEDTSKSCQPNRYGNLEGKSLRVNTEEFRSLNQKGSTSLPS